MARRYDKQVAPGADHHSGKRRPPADGRRRSSAGWSRSYVVTEGELAGESFRVSPVPEAVHPRIHEEYRIGAHDGAFQRQDHALRGDRCGLYIDGPLRVPAWAGNCDSERTRSKAPCPVQSLEVYLTRQPAERLRWTSGG